MMDVDATCSCVIEAACRLIGADYGAFGILDGEGRVHFYGMWGAKALRWQTGQGHHLFGGLGSKATRTTILSHLPERRDAERDEFANSLAEEARTVLVVPLKGSSGRLGSMLLGWRTDIKPTRRQITMIEMLAEQATEAILCGGSGVHAVEALRDAIEQDRLVLHYQPIFDVRSLRVSQAEALCRYPHAPSGLAQPDTFIPLAERTGLIGALTDWVMRHAISQWGRWNHAGPTRLAINLSMKDLAEPDLVERFKELFALTGVAPSQVCLELTESALLSDGKHCARILSELTETGVHFSIDDFGAGYTSLSYLKRFPVHELKIDRSLVTDVEHDHRNGTIVRSIIDMAHELNLRVVAEGVESPATLDRLREWGCDYAQGYHLAEAMPAETFVHWLDRGATEGSSPTSL